MDNKFFLGGHVNRTLNFAMQQNYVPLIRNLVLTNNTDADLDDIKITVSFEPQFAKSYETAVAHLEKGKSVEISPIRVIIQPEYLLSLTEKLTANAHFEVTSADEILFTEDVGIDLLAYDEWSGVELMPEIIAAFITPNHPKIAEITGKASEYLYKWNGSPSFTGYQRQNPNEVKKQMAAVFAALQEQNIAYNMPPASYECVGQRVRLPDSVLGQKCGTCLDLSVLYASCLEAVGLNPFIVFIKGHAFCGCWLEDETFPECMTDDVSAVSKRTAEGIEEISLVECTDFVAGKAVEFDKAEKHAKDHLIEPRDFQCAIDVKRARGSGVRPIPMRVVDNGQYKAADYGERSKSEITSAPSAINTLNRGVVASETEMTKQKIWERKLLDLSLRNTLLSFRATKSSIQLMAANLSEIEDELSTGREFKILPVPADWVYSQKDAKIFEIETEKDLISTIASSEFKSSRIRTFISEAELEKNMKYLHRQAKVALEENGSNTLYLALGFLRWFESDLSEKPRYAPLVLIPVDIIRKNQERAYVVRVRDEETQMNITLLEMLKQDFGVTINGLDPLPTDEKGINLPLVFNTVRQAIMAKKRWDIVEMAFLGLFSFSQFIMWNDIRNRAEDLRRNKIVASLISGKMEWQPLESCVSPEKLDDAIKPGDMAVPMSADSSQLTAVCEAAQGQSFVLHGPPGTGKSQTITNMIANALYQNKTVLFVAEKMAALTVVQKRLKSIGLDPFCLELHSNKSQKRAVLDQLNATLETGHIKKPEDYEKTAEELNIERGKLNSFVEELHKKRDYGMSVYDAVCRYEENLAYKGRMSFDRALLENMTADSYPYFRNLLGEAAVCGKEISGNALKLYQNREYSLELRDRVTAALASYRESVAALKAAYSAVCALLSAPAGESYENIAAIKNLCSAMSAAQLLLPDVVSGTVNDMTAAEAEKLLQLGSDAAAAQAGLAQEFETAVFGYDAQTALLSWKKADASWVIGKMSGQGKLVKELKLYAKNPAAVTKENICGYYARLIEYKENALKLSGASPALTAMFGALWNGAGSDFTALSKALSDSLAAKSAIACVKGESSALSAACCGIVSDAGRKTAAAPTLAAYISAAALCLEKENALISEYKIDLTLLCGDDWFEKTFTVADEIGGGVSLLKDRSALLCKLDELSHAGLSNIADDYDAGLYSEDELVPCFDCCMSYSLAAMTISETDVLARFQGAQFDDTIRKYAELTEKFRRLTINELVAKLSAKIPAGADSSAASSEIGILQKAIKSGGRSLSIRKLFDSIPTLLRRICPCMLMSPISVAQYIDPAFPKFDLVIFDEASQLPTSEAVGAIARGENAVIVGDPKQLPPTSFFTANRTDEENYEIEDLESVLEDCLALSMPQEHLLWHYRSRHESLIAYSNAKYYDNKLLTFPSPNDLISEVKLIHVDGFYDKGGNRQNLAEARAIVAEIIRRMEDEKLRSDSVGVVTFSVVQQNLIDDLLQEEFIKRPELEKLNDEAAEPIIIKNLENVQGDERDVILFSIGYGPDKVGKVSMNFGPLNSEGGWRRLNVAISRARKEMLVFATIRPEQIELSKTRSEGVAGLKGFLEFADRGRNALAQNAADAVKTNNVLTEIIAGEIRKAGYGANTEVGSSRYKVDIGVVDPANPEEYILGIICDGDNYRAASTARDRNIVQPSVLSGLGWKIIRVWTMDWLDNPEKAMAKILAEIENAQAPAEEKPAEIKKAEPMAFEQARDEKPAVCGETLVTAVLPVCGTAEMFYSPDSFGKIANCVELIVGTEAPVSRTALVKRILSAWQLTRSGSKVEAIIDNVLEKMNVKSTKEGELIFYWRSDQDPATYGAFRTGAEKRPMEDISRTEIACAIKQIMASQISMCRADLIRETAKAFGYTRTGEVIDASVMRGAFEAQRRGYVSISDDCEKITTCD